MQLLSAWFPGRSQARLKKLQETLLDILQLDAGTLVSGTASRTESTAARTPQERLVEDILSRHFHASGRALSLFGVGLLQLARERARGAEVTLPFSQASDLADLVERLENGSVSEADACRAASFTAFLIDTYGVEGLRAFIAALSPDVSLDDAAMNATGKSLAMLELQWSGSLPHESETKGLGQFIAWSLRLLFKYRVFAVMLIVGMAIQTAYAMMMPIWLNELFDDGITPGNAEAITHALVLLFGGFLLTSMAGLCMDFGASGLGPRALADMRERIFDKLLSLSPRTLNRFNSGDIVSCFASDMFVVENAVVRAIPGIFSKFFLMVGSMATAFILDWRMALVTIFLLAVSFWLPRYIGGFAARASYARKVQDAGVAEFIKESVQTLPIIRTLGLGRHRREAFLEQNARVHRASYKQYLMGELTGRSAVFAISVAQLGVIALGAVLSLNGTVSAGVVVAYIGLLLAIGGGANGIAAFLPTAIQGIGGWQRLEALLQLEPDLPVCHDGAQLGERLDRLELEDVSFSYDGQRLNLDGLSLSEHMPRRIALVGPSGSGKSTVINLLTRSYDPLAGRILLNGIDIREIDDQDLRNKVAVVNQDTTLFSGSIRHNIRMGRPDATDAEVEQAARDAEIHDFIQTLPRGYDTDVGEAGKLLSGGQRQRIVIARALVRNPEVLLLDEATSALDAETEAAINETLMRISANRSMLWVTHRLASCRDMDLICAFRDGRLVEVGSHEELLARKGLYAGMWAKQADISIDQGGHKASITVDGLRQFPLFASLPDDALGRIRGMLRVEEVAEGTVLLREGATSGRFYIIARGTVESTVRLEDGSEKVMEILEVGDSLGEFALLEGIPNATTCRTRHPCMLLSLSRPDLNELAREHADMEAQIVASLDRRLDAKLEELVWNR